MSGNSPVAAALRDARIPDQPALAAQATRVRELLTAVRAAADRGERAELEPLFAPRSPVRVPWSAGSGLDLAAPTRGGVPAVHETGPVAVVVNGRRALAEVPCAVPLPGAVERPAVSRRGGSLWWRAERFGGRWLVVSVDLVGAAGPAAARIGRPAADVDELLDELLDAHVRWLFAALTTVAPGSPLRPEDRRRARAS